MNMNNSLPDIPLPTKIKSIKVENDVYVSLEDVYKYFIELELIYHRISNTSLYNDDSYQQLLHDHGAKCAANTIKYLGLRLKGVFPDNKLI